MSAHETPLGTYQRWMRSVVTHPGSDSEAWLSEDAQAELPLPKALEYVGASPSLSQMERVGIYRRMYFLRMRDSLAMDYPGVQYAVGTAEFERLVVEYCKVHPSQSYTLNHLGNSFPAFLAVLDMNHAQELAGLARFELAMTHLLDENRVHALTAGGLRKYEKEGLENLFLKTVPSLRLLTLDRPYQEYLRSAYQGEDAPFPPAQQTTYLVIYQDEEFDIVWKEVGEAEYLLLTAFGVGMPLSGAMEKLAEALPGAVEEAASNVGEWLKEWLDLEFFIDPGSGASR